MTNLLLEFFYLARPLTFTYIPVTLFGLSLFEIVAALLFAILILAYLFSRRSRSGGFDSLDVTMLAFIGWCGVVTVIQWDVSDWKWSLRWTIPLVIYMLLRRVIRSERDFMRYLRNLLVGLVIVNVANAIAIFLGRGFIGANWFTGIERYIGIFKDVHTMAHTVGFSLMVMVIYFGLRRSSQVALHARPSRLLLACCIAVVPLALYSLAKGNVRTVVVGLLVFAGLLLLMTNRRRFILFVVCVSAVWIASPFVKTVFWDITGRVSTQGEKMEMAGSGRPWIWRHNLELYADLPAEQKLMGIGVGNEIGVIGANGVITSMYRDRAWESHNDFLSALMELGIVGLGLQLGILWLWFRAILKLPRTPRVLYLSLLAAVSVMNFLSNSYLSRFGLGQLLAMVMIGIHAIPSGATVPGYLAGVRSIAGLGVARRSPI